MTDVLEVAAKVREGLRRDAKGDWVSRVYLGTVRDRDGNAVQDRRQGSADGSLPEDEAVRRISEQVMRRKVGELLPRYLDGIAPFRSPNTLDAYRSAARVRVLPALGNRPACEVGVAEAQAFAAALARPDADGRALSPSTVRQTVAMLSGAWSSWLEDGLVESNPWRSVVTAPPESSPPDVLDGAELGEVAAAIGAGLDPEGQAFGKAACCALMLDAGLRRGEACAATWADWDPRHGTLRVTGTVVDARGGRPRERRPYTKGKRARAVGVSDEMASVIESSPAPRDPGGPIFPGRGGGFESPSAVGRWLSAACRKVGVECHCHELRHTNATQLLWGGVDFKTVQARLGHASPATTLRIYAAAMPDTDRATANAMARAVEGAKKMAGVTAPAKDGRKDR